MGELSSAALYTLLVMVFSAPLWVVVARHGLRDLPAVVALMWCPAAAGVVAAWLSGRRIGAFGWRWPGLGFMGASYAIPVAYAAVAYGVIWALGFGRPDLLHYANVTHRAFWPALPLLASVGVLGACLRALGEEIGWRGFLVPVLAARFGLRGAAFGSGVIWTAWHLPLIVFGDYNGGTPAWYGVGCFTVMVMGLALLFAWMRLASASVWPCMMLHGVHNTVVQAVFTPLTAGTGHTAWFIDEFGAVLPIVVLVTVALVMWRAPARLAG